MFMKSLFVLALTTFLAHTAVAFAEDNTQETLSQIGSLMRSLSSEAKEATALGKQDCVGVLGDLHATAVETQTIASGIATMLQLYAVPHASEERRAMQAIIAGVVKVDIRALDVYADLLKQSVDVPKVNEVFSAARLRLAARIEKTIRELADLTQRLRFQ